MRGGGSIDGGGAGGVSGDAIGSPTPPSGGDSGGNPVEDFATPGLPTESLEQFGTALAVQAGLAPAAKGPRQKQAVERVGKAFGLAVLGAAIESKPPPTPTGILPDFGPSRGDSKLLYDLALLALVAIAIAVVAWQYREGLGPEARNGSFAANLRRLRRRFVRS